MSLSQKDAYWGQIAPNDRPWNADSVLQQAAVFILNNKIIPRLVPTEEALQGPAVFDRKGAGE
jgi:hypothetical protein